MKIINLTNFRKFMLQHEFVNQHLTYGSYESLYYLNFFQYNTFTIYI